MANEKPLKHYESIYDKDEHGEFYRVKVPYKDGQVEVQLDLADFEEFAQYNWSVLSVRGVPKYLTRHYRTGDKGHGKRQQLHQLLMGTKPPMEIDHIDNNGFNCRRNNMRPATRAENSRNCIKKKNGTSIYKGVSWNKQNKKWTANVKYNGEQIYLGQFPKQIINGIDEGEKKAARAYDKGAVKYHGAFALVNMPVERDIVQTLKGGQYRRSRLFNASETQQIESTIKKLQAHTNNEIMEILEAMALQDIIDMCHYFTCGIEQLITEIKRGVDILRKHG